MSKLENWVKEFVIIVSMWVIMAWISIGMELQAGRTDIYLSVSVFMLVTGTAITFMWLLIRWTTGVQNEFVKRIEEQLSDQIEEIIIWKQEVKEKNEEIERLNKINNIVTPKTESGIPPSPYGPVYPPGG